MSSVKTFRFDSLNLQLRQLINRETINNQFIISICLSGKLSIYIDNKLYNYAKHDAIILIPGSTIEMKKCTDDFKSMHIVIRPEIASFFTKVENSFQYKYIRLNPICTMSSYQFTLIENYLNIIEKMTLSNHPKHHYSKLSLERALAALQLEVGGVFLNSKFEFSEYFNKSDLFLLGEFLSSVRANHVEHREVQFYADEQNLSRRYFSRTIKSVSSKTAKEWINLETLESVEALLEHTDLDINTISMEMNFSSASALNEFFKKETHMSPSEYRIKKANELIIKADKQALLDKIEIHL